MGNIRHLIARRPVAALICVLALWMKLVVPGGYMIATDHGWPTITLCPQVTSMPAMQHRGAHHHHPKGGTAKPELPCAFTGLAAAAVSATDPIQLSALIAFVTALALVRGAYPLPRAIAQLRPPSRGPPTFA